MKPNHFYYGEPPPPVMFGPLGGLGSTPEKKKPVSKRDMDIENDVGNYLITAFQLKRLEDRLAGRVSTFPHKSSEVMYRTDSGDWVQISIDVKRLTVRPPEGEEEKDPNPNNVNVIEPDPNTTPMPFFLATRPWTSSDLTPAGSGGIVTGSEVHIAGTTTDTTGAIRIEEGTTHGEFTVMTSGEWAGLTRSDRVAEHDSPDEDVAP